MKKFLLSLAAAVVSLAASYASAQESDITTVLSADFSVFSEGSPEEPVTIPSYGTGSFTSYFPSWYVSGSVAQAGGALLMKDGSSVRTNYNNLSANGGCFRVTLEVKAMDSYGGAVTVTVGYTGGETIFLTDQWETVDVIMTGGTSMSNVTIAPFLSVSGVLVKSMVIEQSASFIAAPVAYQPSSATATSFTASWKRVSGATDYLLDVYSYAADGETREYFLQNQSCGTATSYKVENLDPDKKYYYVVRASNGVGVSNDSNEIEVVIYISSIDAPVISVESTDGNFTLNWEPVENAEHYEVDIYTNETLTEAGLSDVLSEDFSLVNEGTMSSLSFDVYNLDKWTQTPGWDGLTTNMALSAGMLVLDKYGTDRYLATPVLDLSADNGNVTVTVNMAESFFGKFYEGAKVNVALVTYNSGDEDYTVISSEEVTIDATEFKEYTVNLTGGTSACRIKITSDDANENRIFLDDVTVSQMLPAGAVQRRLYSQTRCDETTFSGSVEPQENVTYSATVTAIGRTVMLGEIAEIYSSPSNEVAFGALSGVENVAVEAGNDTTAEYFDLNGRRVANPSAGIYIRRQGSTVTKVILH